MSILITGAAGFIGFHTAERLLKTGVRVTGIDNMNDYYDVNLKRSRLERLGSYELFKFHQADIADPLAVERIFAEDQPAAVIHLAAQAGVRYSLVNPQAYIQSNLNGFLNILEACRRYSIGHLIYASSSSVYGANKRMPWSVSDNVDHPVSLYAATKKSNELMAHSYSHLFNIPTTGLRFFTVYGPWGRPDMAYFSFVKSILAGKPIQVFNYGEMKRDFTYIDDIVDAIVKLIDHVPASSLEEQSDTFSRARYKVYNIGNHRPVDLKYFIAVIEDLLGEKASMEFMPMQPGDVHETYADIDPLKKDIGFMPRTSIEEGLKHFVDWYREYYVS